MTFFHFLKEILCQQKIMTYQWNQWIKIHHLNQIYFKNIFAKRFQKLCVLFLFIFSPATMFVMGKTLEQIPAEKKRNISQSLQYTSLYLYILCEKWVNQCQWGKGKSKNPVSLTLRIQNFRRSPVHFRIKNWRMQEEGRHTRGTGGKQPHNIATSNPN